LPQATSVIAARATAVHFNCMRNPPGFRSRSDQRIRDERIAVPSNNAAISAPIEFIDALSKNGAV
jgi:hypothetical protein